MSFIDYDLIEMWEVLFFYFLLYVEEELILVFEFFL